MSADLYTLLVTALDEISDAVSLFRIDDGARLIRVYRNRTAAVAPDVSFAEIAEAIAGDGAVLRAGIARDSVCEMRVRRFSTFDGRFAIAIERDVTERDRLERAYDDAVFRAQIRADRYARLCRLRAQPWRAQRERVAAILEFALRETRMGSALLMTDVRSEIRLWKVAGDPSLAVAIPDSLVRADHAAGSKIAIAWPGAPPDASFSICSIALGGHARALLVLGRAGPVDTSEDSDPPKFVDEFLSLCTLLAVSSDANGP